MSMICIKRHYDISSLLYFQMLSDALYKSGVDQIVKVLVNSTEKTSVPTYYYLLNTTVEALKLPYWREVRCNKK